MYKRCRAIPFDVQINKTYLQAPKIDQDTVTVVTHKSDLLLWVECERNLRLGVVLLLPSFFLEPHMFLVLKG